MAGTGLFAVADRDFGGFLDGGEHDMGAGAVDTIDPADIFL